VLRLNPMDELLSKKAQNYKKYAIESALSDSAEGAKSP
jgi:hypothetical protein